jgi:hypothetical protein
MDMECSLAVAVLFREWSGVLCFETILLFVFHVMSLRVFFISGRFCVFWSHVVGYLMIFFALMFWTRQEKGTQDML